MIGIYLAGKITRYSNDWRNKVLKPGPQGRQQKYSKNSYEGNGDEWIHPGDHQMESVLEMEEWPVTFGIVKGQPDLDYTGPYFMSCDHGCFHGKNSHGVGAFDGGEIKDSVKHDGLEKVLEDRKKRQEHTVMLCRKAIENSSIFFAWIDDKTCYGTIAEIGYAKALGKTILIGGKKRFEDLWFVYAMADICEFDFEDPHEALTILLELNDVGCEIDIWGIPTFEDEEGDEFKE